MNESIQSFVGETNIYIFVSMVGKPIDNKSWPIKIEQKHTYQHSEQSICAGIFGS